MIKRINWFLGLLILGSGVLGFFTLSRGHLWWDDFAGYLLQAKSILTWSMADFIHHSTFTIQNSSYPPGPVAYPWGFPLLITPVYAIFGLNPLALKLVNLVFYAAFLLSAYYLARTRLTEKASLLVTGLFAFAPALLAANDLIQSDLPFLFFSTLGLVLVEYLYQSKEEHRAGWGVLTGVVIFLAFFLRANGIFLFAPFFITLLLQSCPDWKTAFRKALPALLTFTGLAVIQAVLFPGGQVSYLSHFSMFSPQRLLENALYYLWLPAWSFDQIPAGATIYPVMAMFTLFSIYKHARRDAGLHIYGLITVLLFVVWPERQGLRFIYPVLPMFFIAAFDGMNLCVQFMQAGWQRMAQKVVYSLWSVIILVCLSFSVYAAYRVMAGGRDINGPFDVYSYQMYAFIREETPATSAMIFVRPRALRLFTDRDVFMTENCSDLPKGDYAVIHLKMEANGQIDPDLVTGCNPAVTLEEVFRNKRFVVYKIIKK